MSLRYLILLALFLAIALADFDEDDIEDTYARRRGDPNDCPEEIEFDDDDLDLEADEIELDDEDCEGGVIRLSENPSKTTADKYLRDRRSRIGDFLAGEVDGKITCGSKSLADNEPIILIEPEEDITLRFEELFGEDSELAKREDGEYRLDDDTKYLIVGDRCFYEEANIVDRVCFPGSSTVRVRSGEVKRMDELQIGDEVEVGGGEYSAIFAWTHQTKKSARSYIKIETEGGLSVTVTPTHFVYVDGEAVAANKVKVGDIMTTGNGEKTGVTKVGKVKAKGLYNPQTINGDIVVDGLLVTTYTTAIQPVSGHALLAPVRAVYSMLGRGLSWPQGVSA